MRETKLTINYYFICNQGFIFPKLANEHFGKSRVGWSEREGTVKVNNVTSHQNV